jgi:hypothetical protein
VRGTRTYRGVRRRPLVNVRVSGDHGGVVRRENLRVIHRRHPAFAHEGGDASKYPTRLRGGQKLADHDDWDCIEDFEVVGLAENVGTGVNPVYRLTDKGREVAGLTRGRAGRGQSSSSATSRPTTSTTYVSRRPQTRARDRARD